MSWAKSVLPMFTGDSSEKLRIAPDQVQIDTTHFRPQAPPKSALSRTRLAVNRTAVIWIIRTMGSRGAVPSRRNGAGVLSFLDEQNEVRPLLIASIAARWDRATFCRSLKS